MKDDQIFANYVIAEAAKRWRTAERECARIGNYEWASMDKYDRERNDREFREAGQELEDAHALLVRVIDLAEGMRQ